MGFIAWGQRAACAAVVWGLAACAQQGPPPAPAAAATAPPPVAQPPLWVEPPPPVLAPVGVPASVAGQGVAPSLASPWLDDQGEAGLMSDLLREAYQLRLLNAPQLAAELERLEREPPSAEQRLRWSLALAQTLHMPDTQKALVLVQEVLESPDPASVALRPLAHLLGHLLREQRRLDGHNDRLGAQLRESQRRVEQLSDRIEAMRAIERSLNRPATRAPLPVRPPAP
jgi:hypothetical protein